MKDKVTKTDVPVLRIEHLIIIISALGFVASSSNKYTVRVCKEAKSQGVMSPRPCTAQRRHFKMISIQNNEVLNVGSYTPTRRGFCYLWLFAPAEWTAIATTIGPWPTVDELRKHPRLMCIQNRSLAAGSGVAHISVGNRNIEHELKTLDGSWRIGGSVELFAELEPWYRNILLKRWIQPYNRWWGVNDVFVHDAASIVLDVRSLPYMPSIAQSQLVTCRSGMRLHELFSELYQLREHILHIDVFHLSTTNGICFFYQPHQGQSSATLLDKVTQYLREGFEACELTEFSSHCTTGVVCLYKGISCVENVISETLLVSDLTKHVGKLVGFINSIPVVTSDVTGDQWCGFMYVLPHSTHYPTGTNNKLHGLIARKKKFGNPTVVAEVVQRLSGYSRDLTVELTFGSRVNITPVIVETRCEVNKLELSPWQDMPCAIHGPPEKQIGTLVVGTTVRIPICGRLVSDLSEMELEQIDAVGLLVAWFECFDGSCGYVLGSRGISIYDATDDWMFYHPHIGKCHHFLGVLAQSFPTVAMLADVLEEPCIGFNIERVGAYAGVPLYHMSPTNGMPMPRAIAQDRIAMLDQNGVIGFSTEIHYDKKIPIRVVSWRVGASWYSVAVSTQDGGVFALKSYGVRIPQATEDQSCNAIIAAVQHFYWSVENGQQCANVLDLDYRDVPKHFRRIITDTKLASDHELVTRYGCCVYPLIGDSEWDGSTIMLLEMIPDNILYPWFVSVRHGHLRYTPGVTSGSRLKRLLDVNDVYKGDDGAHAFARFLEVNDAFPSDWITPRHIYSVARVQGPSHYIVPEQIGISMEEPFYKVVPAMSKIEISQLAQLGCKPWTITMQPPTSEQPPDALTKMFQSGGVCNYTVVRGVDADGVNLLSFVPGSITHLDPSEVGSNVVVVDSLPFLGMEQSQAEAYTIGEIMDMLSNTTERLYFTVFVVSTGATLSFWAVECSMDDGLLALLKEQLRAYIRYGYEGAVVNLMFGQEPIHIYNGYIPFVGTTNFRGRRQKVTGKADVICVSASIAICANVGYGEDTVDYDCIVLDRDVTHHGNASPREDRGFHVGSQALTNAAVAVRNIPRPLGRSAIKWYECDGMVTTEYLNIGNVITHGAYAVVVPLQGISERSLSVRACSVILSAGFRVVVVKKTTNGCSFTYNVLTDCNLPGRTADNKLGESRLYHGAAWGKCCSLFDSNDHNFPPFSLIGDVMDRMPNVVPDFAVEEVGTVANVALLHIRSKNKGMITAEAARARLCAPRLYQSATGALTVRSYIMARLGADFELGTCSRVLGVNLPPFPTSTQVCAALPSHVPAFRLVKTCSFGRVDVFHVVLTSGHWTRRQAVQEIRSMCNHDDLIGFNFQFEFYKLYIMVFNAMIAGNLTIELPLVCLSIQQNTQTLATLQLLSICEPERATDLLPVILAMRLGLYSIGICLVSKYLLLKRNRIPVGYCARKIGVELQMFPTRAEIIQALPCSTPAFKLSCRRQMFGMLFYHIDLISGSFSKEEAIARFESIDSSARIGGRLLRTCIPLCIAKTLACLAFGNKQTVERWLLCTLVDLAMVYAVTSQNLRCYKLLSPYELDCGVAPYIEDVITELHQHPFYVLPYKITISRGVMTHCSSTPGTSDKHQVIALLEKHNGRVGGKLELFQVLTVLAIGWTCISLQLYCKL